MEQHPNFLGFHIDASTFPIRLPEQKRDVATVLSDDLFRAFGSNALRLNTLQQIRGNIEHFKSTNILRSYFASPIDALLGCGDESGLWVMGANPDFWTAFWAPMEVIRLIRSNESKWGTCFAVRWSDSCHLNNALRVSTIQSG